MSVVYTITPHGPRSVLRVTPVVVSPQYSTRQLRQSRKYVNVFFNKPYATPWHPMSSWTSKCRS